MSTSWDSVLRNKRTGPMKELSGVGRRKGILGRGKGSEQSDFSETKGRESLPGEFQWHIGVGSSMISWAEGWMG